ncbi:MAG: D-aminoacyl-tRNA deacylase [Acidobacteriota bacterium]
MRAVVQRVSSARVVVDGQVTGSIGLGLVVLIGVTNDDGPGDVQYIAGKVRDLRVFDDAGGKMNLAAGDVGGAVLAVSQFTLYGDTRRGRRPSWDRAAPAPVARALYEATITAMRDCGLRVETGVFQARMSVELVNDGPVTLLLDSRD